MRRTEDEHETGRVIGIRVSADLMRQVEARAADEGLSLSAVARRALIRDLKAVQPGARA
jgi:predicted DNA binding CopG/RHH family protein